MRNLSFFFPHIQQNYLFLFLMYSSIAAAARFPAPMASDNGSCAGNGAAAGETRRPGGDAVLIVSHDAAVLRLVSRTESYDGSAEFGLVPIAAITPVQIEAKFAALDRRSDGGGRMRQARPAPSAGTWGR